MVAACVLLPLGLPLLGLCFVPLGLPFLGLPILGLWFVSLVYLSLACGLRHWSALPWPVVHVILLVSGFAEQAEQVLCSASVRIWAISSSSYACLISCTCNSQLGVAPQEYLLSCTIECRIFHARLSMHLHTAHEAAACARQC